MAKYQVQEFAAGKWWAVGSYSSKEEAQQHAKWIGSKARVVETDK
jgi:hypothetical protein